MRQDAVQRGDKVVGLDAHIDKAADHVRHVIGMNGSENQMAGKRRLNCDLRRLLVANFADHDLVRVVPQDGPQTAGKSEAFFFVDGNLCDAANLIFDGVFNGDELVVVALDFVDGRVQSGGLAGTRRARNQDHAVRLVNVAPETVEFLGRKADHVQSQVGKFLGKCFFVEHAKNCVFAVAGRHDRYAQVDVTAFVLHSETAVLRNAALGDIQFAQNLDAREHCGVMFLGDRLHGVLQDTVNAVLHGDFRVLRFDVDVAGAALKGSEDDGLDQANHRAGGAIARQAIAGNGLFAFLFFLGGLQGKGFGSLFENALRLLGSFQKIADLASCRDTNQELLAEQELQFVAAMDLTRIGSRNDQCVVMLLQGNEVVAKHQVRGNLSNQIRVDALFAQIDKGVAVSFGQFAGKLPFLQLVGG